MVYTATLFSETNFDIRSHTPTDDPGGIETVVLSGPVGAKGVAAGEARTGGADMAITGIGGGVGVGMGWLWWW